MWLKGAPEGVVERVRGDRPYESEHVVAGGARDSGRLRSARNPPARAPEIDPKPNILHLFSQPRAPEFLAAQETFSAANPWFSVKRLDAVSHFPPLEIPDVTAAATSGTRSGTPATNLPASWRSFRQRGSSSRRLWPSAA